MEAALNRIAELFEQKYGGSEVFLVDSEILPGNLIRVFVDSDSGLTIARCAEISRYLEFHISYEGLAPERHTLEVSSPGVGQPLKLLRQYRKNVGRMVEVDLADHSRKEGVLVEATDERLRLRDAPPAGRPQAAKAQERSEFDIPFGEILATRVKVSFKKEKTDN